MDSFEMDIFFMNTYKDRSATSPSASFGRSMRFIFSRSLHMIAVAGCITAMQAVSIARPVFAQEAPTLLKQVYGRFNAQFPGRGVTDYPGNTIADIPKSYAMILMAELERRRHGIAPELPDLTGTAGRWLLKNASLNTAGTVGWGLPIAWDAYSDGSENPANTIYSISTAIVADALMDWMDTDPTAPGAEIITTLSQALAAFARAPRSPSGMLPYSLQMADAAYDTFNSAAYLAGQMQRFAKYVKNQHLAAELRTTADETVAQLAKHRKIRASGAWYWTYSIKEDVPNDLPHASYIIDGLKTYVDEGGHLAEKIDIPAVLVHFGDFFDDQGKPRAWPVFRPDISTPPRLYDLGMALSLACTEPSLERFIDQFTVTIPSYRSSKGEFAKLPTIMSPLVVNEYEAYLWRGLVACQSKKNAHERAKLRAVGDIGRYGLPAQSTRGIPFVKLGSPGAEVSVEFREGWSQFNLPWSPSRVVRIEGVAGQIVDDGLGGSVIMRGYPANDLKLVPLDANGVPQAAFPLEHSPGSAPILRSTAFHDNLLYVVYYDNPTLANYLVRYRRKDTTYVRVGEPLRLPSLNDPAGGTYEMIPAIFLLPNGADMHIIGGTLDARQNRDGTLTEARFKNCSRVLEAVATGAGPAVLCAQVNEVGDAAPFELQGPASVTLPDIASRRGIPYNLRYTAGTLRISLADSPQGFAQMLRFDIERANAGWLEYGTDNVEGRVAWSQIYYLNGFLDLLLLSKDGGSEWNALHPLLKEIRVRLDEELFIADRNWREGRYATRAFTVDRSRALFAVQTSRLLLLANRYTREVHEPVDLPGRADLQSATAGLQSHIEILAHEGQQPNWIPPRTPYLKWPRGSGFYFDGLNVPFNHQNEWAYSLLDRADGDAAGISVSTPMAIVTHFLRRIAPDGRLPLSGTWDYWWGQAYDGWSASDKISINKPKYPGDHIAAWISFRSIDTMSSLAAASRLNASFAANLRESAAALVATGRVYPFVAYELRRAGTEVDLPTAVARRYIRVSSPWEIQNAAWAYAAELRRLGATR